MSTERRSGDNSAGAAPNGATSVARLLTRERQACGDTGLSGSVRYRDGAPIVASGPGEIQAQISANQVAEEG